MWRERKVQLFVKLIFVSFLLSYRLRRIDDLKKYGGYFWFFERRRKNVYRV